MTTHGLVTILVPARNEAAAIAKTLRSLPRATLAASGFDTEVFVLDGHSTDATRDLALLAGATVIPDRERGKGNAVRHARHIARGAYTVMLDGDGTYPPDAIPRLLDPLVCGEADIVMGTRRPLRGAMRPLHRVGNRLLSWTATALCGETCGDLCTGMWAFRTEVLQGLPLQSERYGLEAEMFAVATRMGFSIRRAAIDYLPRRGHSGLSWQTDGARIFRRLVKARISPLPVVAPRRLGTPLPTPTDDL
ncbi:MAG: glycosyltransferase [Thermoplasmatota archaeon]